MSTGSPKQTLVQWQLLLTSQGDQMAHLSTKEKEVLLRAGEENKAKKAPKQRGCMFLSEHPPSQELTALLLQTTVVWKTAR